MDITIFKDLTTNEFLTELEEESKKYDGLYVDMDEAEQRKYVKDKAQGINDLLKKLNRARIDASASYKKKVEQEASEIKERLENANKPFTLLIDEHKEKRAKILAEEKARKEAIDLAVKLEADHEFALLMNDKFDSEKEQREADRLAQKQALKDEAVKRAIEQEQARVVQQKQAEENERLRRLADTEHKANINRSILEVLISNNIDVETAKNVIRLAAKNKLPNVTINY